MKDPREIIKRALVTEKGTKSKDEQNKYFFMVSGKANKLEIKKAIQELFKVKVTKVVTFNVLGKIKRLGRFEGRKSSWKKAVVTLAKGEKIELFEGV
ncbi:MAG: 50S ribosomal protein L23 [Candidatus Edwardsbacteria bacterium]